MTMGEKFNIVSKFPNSIINNLSQQLKDSLKTCKSSNRTKIQKHAKRSRLKAVTTNINAKNSAKKLINFLEI